jgi:hypothetical protein
VRYRLSKLIPVPMRSTYGVVVAAESDTVQVQALRRQRSTWWQFRGHVFRHRIAVL